MTTMQKIEEIRNIVAEYNFGERKVQMYAFAETVNEILSSDGFNNYWCYTRSSRAQIDAEVKGLYDVVLTWKKLADEQKVEIILVKSGKHKFVPQSELECYIFDSTFAVLA